MSKAKIVKIIIILAHATVMWALCGAIMGIGPTVTSMKNTLIIHAILVPVIAIGVSLIYFRKFRYTTPLQTAIVFISFALFMDFLVVSSLILRNYEMFASISGLWGPMTLMFAAIYLTGLFAKKKV